MHPVFDYPRQFFLAQGLPMRGSVNRILFGAVQFLEVENDTIF